MIKLKHLIKESLGKTEVYHTTDIVSAKDIIQNGVDINKAGTKHLGAGSEQGKGFYLYKDKRSALSHAKEYKTEVILVFHVNISPEDFDVDYEAMWKIAAAFLLKNIDYVKQNANHLGIKNIRQMSDGGYSIVVSYQGKVGGIHLSRDFDDTSITDATKMAVVFQNLSKIDKQMFMKFKIETLSRASAIKYVGNERIFPIRVEDLTGKVISEL